MSIIVYLVRISIIYIKFSNQPYHMPKAVNGIKVGVLKFDFYRLFSMKIKSIALGLMTCKCIKALKFIQQTS